VVVEWATEQRKIWLATGLSIGQFAVSQPIDKGTISRYLNGERVPRDHWFLDALLTILAEQGKPVTPAVHDHLTMLQLRALEVRHPHEYRVRLVQDKLRIAVTDKREADCRARALEEQLAERHREIQRLTEDKNVLRAAKDAEHRRLTREIGEITRRLRMAEERAVQAECRCAVLEDLLELLDSPTSTEDSPTSTEKDSIAVNGNSKRRVNNGPPQPWTRSKRSHSEGNGLEVLVRSYDLSRDLSALKGRRAGDDNPEETIVSFTPTAWGAFITDVRRGLYDATPSRR
jgi:hypothetical protein